jgi:hypothetical protein
MNTAQARDRAQQYSRVDVRENSLHALIIVPLEQQLLAWGGTRWIPVTEDGLPAGDLRPVSFTTVEGAKSYAESQGFEVVA